MAKLSVVVIIWRINSSITCWRIKLSDGSADTVGRLQRFKDAIA